MLTDSSSRLRDLPFDLQTRILAAHAAQLPVDGAVFTARSVARLVVGRDLDDPAYDAAYEPACARTGLRTAVCGTWRATYRQLVQEIEAIIGRRLNPRKANLCVAALEQPRAFWGAWRKMVWQTSTRNCTLLLRILVDGCVDGDAQFRATDDPEVAKKAALTKSDEDDKSIKTRHSWLNYALSGAVEYNSADAVRVLLEAGANPAGRNECGELIVAFAAEREAVQEMDLLLDAGAPLYDDAQDGHGYGDPLAEAAFHGSMPTARRLLERGADPHRIDRRGRTTLFRACETNWRMIEFEPSKLKVVRLLLNAGVDPEARAHDGRQAMDVARENGFVSIVEALALGNVDEWIAEEEELAADVRAGVGGSPPEEGDEIIREEV